MVIFCFVLVWRVLVGYTQLSNCKCRLVFVKELDLEACNSSVSHKWRPIFLANDMKNLDESTERGE